MKAVLTIVLLFATAGVFAQSYTTCLAGHCESGSITLDELQGVTSIEVNQSNPDSQVEINGFSLMVGSKECSSSNMSLSEACMNLLKTAAVGDEIKIHGVSMVILDPAAPNVNIPELVLTVVDNP